MPDAISIDALDARRNVPELGIREEVGFLGSADSKILCVLYAPLGPCTGGVLICPPLHGESARNYRREVLLARALAARGVAALRFHYKGTGHSDGHVEDMTFTRFCEDAQMAAEHLASALQSAPIAFFGTRLGGCVAVATATSTTAPDAPLALWEPVLNGRSYFRELLRMKLMSDVTGGAEVAETQQSLLRRLEEEGSIEITGFVIGRNLYESVVALDMSDLLKEANNPVLLVQIGTDGLRGPYASLIDDLRHSKRTAEVALIHGRESWWFSRGPDALQERSESVRQLLDTTVDWTARTLAMKVST